MRMNIFGLLKGKKTNICSGTAREY